MHVPVLDIVVPVHNEQGTLGAGGVGTWAQAWRFAVVGGLTTVIHLGLFATLRGSVVPSSQAANLVGLLLATLVNTALNRRWTFGVRGAGATRHQLQGLAVFAVTWLLTAGALGLVHGLVAAPSTALATTAVAAATAASTVVRFLAMRSWMFRGPQASLSTHVPAACSNPTMPGQS